LILGFYIGKECYQFFTDAHSNVAFMAHTGGFISGSLLMAATYFINPKIFNQEYIREDQTIDPVQEKLAIVYDFIGNYQFEAAKKALERVIDEHGLTFEFSVLRYNLTKIDKGSEYQQTTKALLSTKKVSALEARQLKQVWLDNPEQHKQLDDEASLNLGFNFLKFKNPHYAAMVCDQLVEEKCDDVSLYILARKISAAFESINDLNKKKKYDMIANDLMEDNL